MKKIFYMLAAGTMLATSCQNEDVVENPSNQALKVGDMFTLKIGTGNPDTKVAVNPYVGTGTYWTDNEKITAYDMTDGFYDEAIGAGIPRQSKLTGLADVGTGANNEFFGSMPITGVTDNGDGTTNVDLNFYAVYPCLQMLEELTNDLDRNPNGIPYNQFIVPSENGNYDELTITHPRMFDINVNVQDPAGTEAVFHKYGEFLPHIAIPIQGRSITVDNETRESVSTDGQPVVLEFMHAYNTVQVEIDPSEGTPQYDAIKDIKASHMRATITMLDGNQFQRTDKFRMNDVPFTGDGTASLLGGARRGLDVTAQNLETSAIMNMRYFLADGKTPYLVTPLTRKYGEHTTIDFLMATPRAKEVVKHFKLEIEFFDTVTPSTEPISVMKISKEFNDARENVTWDYGKSAKISLGIEDFHLEEYGVLVP